MTIKMEISQNYGNGLVQISAKEPNGYTRYFDVPAKNTLNFTKELNNQYKKANRNFNITLFSTIFTGCFGAALFTKKMQSFGKKFAIQAAAGIGLSTIGTVCINEYNKKCEKEILRKYKAKELNVII